jgi:hypothetical protein
LPGCSDRFLEQHGRTSLRTDLALRPGSFRKEGEPANGQAGSAPPALYLAAKGSKTRRPGEEKKGWRRVGGPQPRLAAGFCERGRDGCKHFMSLQAIPPALADASG